MKPQKAQLKCRGLCILFQLLEVLLIPLLEVTATDPAGMGPQPATPVGLSEDSLQNNNTNEGAGIFGDDLEAIDMEGEDIDMEGIYGGGTGDSPFDRTGQGGNLLDQVVRGGLTLGQLLDSLEDQEGEQGEQGLQGERGLRGLQGLQGERGERGLRGIQGIQGLMGQQGLQGIQGIQGERESEVCRVNVV